MMDSNIYTIIFFNHMDGQMGSEQTNTTEAA